MLRFVGLARPANRIFSHLTIVAFASFQCASSVVLVNSFPLLFKIRAQKTPTRHTANRNLARTLICGDCGSKLRKKIIGSNVYWVCRRHDADRTACPSTQIPQREIYAAFLRLYYKLKHQGTTILEEVRSNLLDIRNCRMLWSEDIISLNNQISDISSQNQLLAQLNQQGLVDPDIFIYQSNELAEQLRNAKLQKERLLNQSGDHTIEQTQEIIMILDAGPDFLDEFDGELFSDLVEKVIVESNVKIRFRLKNGLELAESIERMKR